MTILVARNSTCIVTVSYLLVIPHISDGTSIPPLFVTFSVQLIGSIRIHPNLCNLVIRFWVIES